MHRLSWCWRWESRPRFSACTQSATISWLTSTCPTNYSTAAGYRRLPHICYHLFHVSPSHSDLTTRVFHNMHSQLGATLLMNWYWQQNCITCLWNWHVYSNRLLLPLYCCTCSNTVGSIGLVKILLQLSPCFSVEDLVLLMLAQKMSVKQMQHIVILAHNSSAYFIMCTRYHIIPENLHKSCILDCR